MEGVVRLWPFPPVAYPRTFAEPPLARRSSSSTPSPSPSSPAPPQGLWKGSPMRSEEGRNRGKTRSTRPSYRDCQFGSSSEEPWMSIRTRFSLRRSTTKTPRTKRRGGRLPLRCHPDDHPLARSTSVTSIPSALLIVPSSLRVLWTTPQVRNGPGHVVFPVRRLDVPDRSEAERRQRPLEDSRSLCGS